VWTFRTESEKESGIISMKLDIVSYMRDAKAHIIPIIYIEAVGEFRGVRSGEEKNERVHVNMKPIT
jgi:hypothetical protein